MRIPVTINENVVKTYRPGKRKIPGKNVLQSDDLFEWDKDIPKTLQDLCLATISTNWEAKPILEEITQTIDRCTLLSMLSTDLPLTLTVPKIEDDIYWKRCYLQKWPKMIPNDVPKEFLINNLVIVRNTSVESNSSASNSGHRSRRSSTIDEKRKWKECFLEMHLRGYLEKLKPEDYDAEKIKELSDLCGPYVRKLEIRELQCAEKSSSRFPMNAILSGLQNLTELAICFKQTYVGENFSWNVVRLPLQDIKLLAKGLEKCKLTVFRIQNSDIDGEKVTLILKALIRHQDLKTLDFSHCHIGDHGAISISKFATLNSFSELFLANNQIGVKGVEALCYAICTSSCNLKTIDLKLNPITDKGADLLMVPLTMGARHIKNLFLNGCVLEKNPSIGKMIEHNSSLEQLDLSNNALGEEMGKMILQGLRYNTQLKKLDVRMCRLSGEDEFEILRKINRNRKSLRFIKKPIIIEPQYDFQISDELHFEIENVFERVAAPSVE